MMNRSIFLIMTVMSLSGFSIGAPKVDTLSLSKQVIPLDKGDPRPLMAIAAIHGKARGQITGEAAKIIKERTKSAAPIFIEAVKLSDIEDQPGCAKVKLTYTTSKEYSAQFPAQSMDVAVCPNKAK
ncbi:hypothetical protein [Neisseria sp. Ec49-e6-T10]|uniref:hypothetical protein n=1 Tax=Neisseria sp. Ec49-e6-T10 TaxID=3140744 RepID=UPI003EB8FF14